MASTTLLGRATLTLQHDFVHLPVPLELCGGENGGFDGEDGNSGGADADAAAAAAAAAAALKEWVWLNHKDLLLEQFVVQCNSGRKRAIEETEDKQAAISSSQTEDTRGDSHGAAAASDLSTAVVSESAAVDHPESSTKKSLDLLATMVRVHRQFFDSQSSKVVFGVFLEALLDIMDSEYGFIGEIKYGGAGSGNERMYLQTHAITNIAWDQASRQFYDDNIENGLKFYNLNTLFGAVMTTGKPVISNQPQSDPRASGIPPGHPPLNHFLGIPFFKSNGEMNGMVGLSNRPGGYSERDIEFLEPVTVMCANLIQIYLQMEQNHYLINSLEESVLERTSELERANAELEEANRRMRQAAEQQLEHFACMSHEIRTPLNCIIGTSHMYAYGLVQDTS